MNIWLIHHAGFFNRGCEAIVQSSVALLREACPGPLRFTLFSQDIGFDRRRAAVPGLVVRDARRKYRLWHLLHALARRGRWGKRLVRTILACPGWGPDLILSIGGDNYTPEYGDPRTWLVQSDRLFMDAGIPVVIWGASIGPFDPETDMGQEMIAHLHRVQAIGVREQVTWNHLVALGLEGNLRRVWDPAFSLVPRMPACVLPAWLDQALGLNVSALIFAVGERSVEEGLAEAVAFVRGVVAQGIPVVLIPHVYREGQDLLRNDLAFLQRLHAALGEATAHVHLVEEDLSASELKAVIGRCRYFIGARTHATIAAMSSGVPTICISYSQKAVGIAQDVFGDTRWLVPGSSLTAGRLLESFDRLRNEEDRLRSFLAERKPRMLEGARSNPAVIKPWLKP